MPPGCEDTYTLQLNSFSFVEVCQKRDQPEAAKHAMEALSLKKSSCSLDPTRFAAPGSSPIYGEVDFRARLEHLSIILTTIILTSVGLFSRPSTIEAGRFSPR
jgi:hypothetical protein